MLLAQGIGYGLFSIFGGAILINSASNDWGSKITYPKKKFMFLIDVLMKFFFVYVRKYGEQGRAGAIIGVSTIISSLLIFFASVLFYFLELSLLKTIGFIGFGLLAMIFYFVTSSLLTRIYIKGKRILLVEAWLIWVYYLLAPMSFLASIIILFLAVRL